MNNEPQSDIKPDSPLEAIKPVEGNTASIPEGSAAEPLEGAEGKLMEGTVTACPDGHLEKPLKGMEAAPMENAAIGQTEGAVVKLIEGQEPDNDIILNETDTQKHSADDTPLMDKGEFAAEVIKQTRSKFMRKSKKTTAVLAVICAAAAAVTGAFAWVMTRDDTELNQFTYNTSESEGEVAIRENFDPDNPWNGKEVWVQNIQEDNNKEDDATVRVRFEEFLEIYKTDDNGNKKGDPVYTARGILTPGGGFSTGTTLKSSLAPYNQGGTNISWGDFITYDFDPNTVMLGAATPVGTNWAIDTDGWCYYTGSLNGGTAPNDPADGYYNGQSSNPLLRKVNAAKNLDKILNDTFGGGEKVVIDYNVNVRLQAMSANYTDDDYGTAAANTEHWDNPAGRVIKAATDATKAKYEILTNTQVAPGSNADTLIKAIKNKLNAA